MTPFRASNLIELLRRRAERQPQRLAYAFLAKGQQEEARLTYSELDRQARNIAAHLQSMVAANERVLLLHPPGLDYIAAFFGCLYAGVTAVPAYPPRRNRPDERISSMAADCNARLALTVSEEQKWDLSPGLESLTRLASDEMAQDGGAAWIPPSPHPDDLAYLQYTSGSTSQPRGVMISHANVLHNLGSIAEGTRHSSRSVLVSWLPFFHDMGLVYGILMPLYRGFCCYAMAPLSFVQRPIRWLEAISRYRATHSGGPDFAYQLCCQKVSQEQRAGLDLSSWLFAFNGSEPIRAGTLRRFAAAFASCGFRQQALYPTYGLAEATLQVSGSPVLTSCRVLGVRGDALKQGKLIAAPEGQEGSQILVGCGLPKRGFEVAIVDPQKCVRLPQGEVGEIWLASPSAALGYWNRPQETRRTFQAFLKDSGKGPFLRTGDLGVLHDGQLFITGRLKDLIIIAGRNYYPQDIELSAEKCHPALRPGRLAAFSTLVEGKERLVVAAEVERTFRLPDSGAGSGRQGAALAVCDPAVTTGLKEVCAAIRQAVSEEHGVLTYRALLLRPGSLPMTSSGKVRRQTARQSFESNSLEVLVSD